jgi:arylsulfatase A-like enzyme
MDRALGRRARPPRAVLLAALLLACAGAPDERPGIVLVLSDDQRFDALGVVQREQGASGRFPWLETPGLDRLAAGGVRFRNAFAVSSLCSPSRAAILSGLYGHANGVVDNDTPLDLAAVTSASLLRAAGYRTGYAGKWHMGKQAERPGFEWWASYLGQGSYFDATFEVQGVPRTTTGWVDDATTDFAIEFLRRHRAEPFLLVVGYKAPHGPRKAENVPERARGRHEGVELSAPRNAAAEPPYAKPRTRKRPPGMGRGVRVYFDLVSAMDDALGRLLDEIDALGIAERTAVVFAGDNGYLLGEHGIVTKRSAYEGSIRIPLLVRWPALGAGAQGAVVDEPVLNVDLAPTLLAIAGVEAPAGLHGRSLLPLLRGERPAWRRAFFYEYFEEPDFALPTHFALRDLRAKLVVFPGRPDWTQLFDLTSDPDELRDLARDPAYAELLAEMRAALEREARAVGFDPARPPPARPPASEKRAQERGAAPRLRQRPRSRARSGAGGRS